MIGHLSAISMLYLCSQYVYDVTLLSFVRNSHGFLLLYLQLGNSGYASISTIDV